MCLNTVTHRFIRKKKVSCKDGNFQVGWKWVDGNLKQFHFPMQGGGPQRYNIWLTAEEPENVYNKQYSYPMGFHIFKRKKDAVAYQADSSGLIVKVHYQDVLAIGKHYVSYGNNDGICVVANKMKVLKPILKKVKK